MLSILNTLNTDVLVIGGPIFAVLTTIGSALILLTCFIFKDLYLRVKKCEEIYLTIGPAIARIDENVKEIKKHCAMCPESEK